MWNCDDAGETWTSLLLISVVNYCVLFFPKNIMTLVSSGEVTTFKAFKITPAVSMISMCCILVKPKKEL
jgi:hypothetical protein